MYTQTTAARMSHSWFDSEFSYAPAAPRNVNVTEAGKAMSFAAWRMASTALPRATPCVVSKPRVVAGYCATCVICSGACFSLMLAKADSGVDLPDPVRTCRSARSDGVVTMPGCASRMTRYWLVSVKIVEMMRWPKALYSASSTVAVVTDMRAALSRSMATVTAAPVAPASVTTLRSCDFSRMRTASLPAHSVTVAVSAPSSETRYCVGPDSASMVRSCVGCRYRVTPATLATRPRRRSMMSSWLSLRERFRLISMLPVCSMVLLAASTPTRELRVSTSGSSSSALAAACCKTAMRAYETACDVSRRACSCPVSCVGNRPFGMTMYSTTVSTRVARATSRVSPWRFSTHTSAWSYCTMTRSRKAWMRWPVALTFSSAWLFSQRADIIGTRVSETTAEIRIVMARVMANSRNRRPTTSPMNSRGMSTAISDTVSEMMVKPICDAPFRAAAIGVSPSSM
ncbi:hypothetical protein D3C81_321890 [compost metagenome]